MQLITSVGAEQAPWLSLPNSDSLYNTLHFSPANGFPTGTYLEFLGFLADKHSVTGMDCRGSWPAQAPPPSDFTMADFANDLIAGLEANQTGPIIGIGHSLGGHVTAVAAVKRPDLFAALVLIEPASLPFPVLDLIYPRLPKALVYALFPFMKGSEQRQRIWESRDEFRERYQTHPTFKRFSRASLENYVKYGLQPSDEGNLELTFSPAWEAHSFRKMEFLWKHIRKLSMPTLIISAEHSNLYTPKQFKKLNNGLKPHIQTQTLAGTHHLLPLEKPKHTATTVAQWIANLSDI